MPVYIASPNPGVENPDQWAQRMLTPKAEGGVGLIEIGRSDVIVFRNFPSEAFQHYVVLQRLIAGKISLEQDRPYIVLELIGSARIANSRAEVGMAGGTGPLSDANFLAELVLRLSGLEHQNIPAVGPDIDMRAKIATSCRDFSGVLYSMPPPRDMTHPLDILHYVQLYREVINLFPCESMYLLSNTAHLNISLFQTFILPNYIKIDDMTKYVANKIAMDIKSKSTQEKKILILGTQIGHDKNLYPTLLNQHNVLSSLPITQAREEKAETQLQNIINAVKAGEMSRLENTIGREFIAFVIEQIRRTNANTLLFSCTEIPLLLEAIDPVTNKTYSSLLKEEIAIHFPNIDFIYYDTEAMFVERVIESQRTLYDCKRPKPTVVDSELNVNKNRLFSMLWTSSFFYPCDTKTGEALGFVIDIVFKHQGDLTAVMQALSSREFEKNIISAETRSVMRDNIGDIVECYHKIMLTVAAAESTDSPELAAVKAKIITKIQMYIDKKNNARSSSALMLEPAEMQKLEVVRQLQREIVNSGSKEEIQERLLAHLSENKGSLYQNFLMGCLDDVKQLGNSTSTASPDAHM